MNNNIEKLIQILDKGLADISGTNIVSTSEMTDLLLDIRLHLMIEQEATPTYESAH